MKNIKLSIVLLIAILISTTIQAQRHTEVVTKEASFEKASADNILKVNNVNGNISVEGYDGKVVRIEATKIYDKRDKSFLDSDKNFDIEVKMLGNEMHVSVAKNASKEHNHSDLFNGSCNSDHSNVEVDFNIKVPKNTSIELTSVNNESIFAKNLNGNEVIVHNVNGNIVLENISSEIETNNVNGNIAMTSINGAVIAEVVNGDVQVDIKKLDANKVYALSSVNGNLSITIPNSSNANVKATTNNGSIESDFSLKSTMPSKNAHGHNFHVQMGDSLEGPINGGGSKIQLTSLNGSIFINSK